MTAALLMCLLANLGAVGGLPEIVKIGEKYVLSYRH